MKSKISFLTAILICTLLTSCTAVGSAQSGIISTGSTATSTAANNLPTSALLIVGSLKLEGTDQTITPAQASDLLFLWQGYKELSTRNSAAPEEKAAILNQVEKSMTTEQMTAISALNLSMKDVLTMARERSSTSSSNTTSNSNRSGTNGTGGGPGGMIITFDGGGPGGLPPDGISPRSSGQTSTNTTQRASRISDNMADALLDPLIKLLEGRIAGK